MEIKTGTPVGIGLILGLITWAACYNYQDINSINDVVGVLIMWWIASCAYSVIEMRYNKGKSLRSLLVAWPWIIVGISQYAVGGYGIGITLIIGGGSIAIILVAHVIKNILRKA